MEVRGRYGESMLTIVGVKLSDWGRFDCEALSRIGGHQKSMFLDIECEWFELVTFCRKLNWDLNLTVRKGNIQELHFIKKLSLN